MNIDDRTDADLPSAGSAVGIWFDLERALEGSNSYGGDVAEIYAYRLLPPDPTMLAIAAGDSLLQERAAGLVSRNLTWIVRRFVELHEGIGIGIENGFREFRPIDPRIEAFPPFIHRIHIRVSQERRIRARVARDLSALRNGMHESATAMPSPEYDRWLAATADLLQAFGPKVESPT